MKSKLFTPKLLETRGAATRAEAGGVFLNPPAHPEIPVFSAKTSGGEACYPLSLSGSGASDTTFVGKRGVRTKNRIIDNY